jgi:hypothetical protein
MVDYIVYAFRCAGMERSDSKNKNTSWAFTMKGFINELLAAALVIGFLYIIANYVL